MSIKAFVIICPDDFREDFCKNFFHLLRTHKKKILIAKLETTEKHEKLKVGKDYILTEPASFINQKLRFIANVERVNGHTYHSGFSVDTFNNIGHQDIIAIYVTGDEDLGQEVKSFYKGCSEFHRVPIIKVDGIGLFENFENDEIIVIQSPEASQKVYDHFFKKKRLTKKEKAKFLA